MAFVTPVMEHWLEREIAQWVENKLKFVPSNQLVDDITYSLR